MSQAAARGTFWSGYNLARPGCYFVLVVSVVVVVTGPGTVVCSEVVVVLLDVVGAVQAESETRTRARQGMMNFFMNGNVEGVV